MAKRKKANKINRRWSQKTRRDKKKDKQKMRNYKRKTDIGRKEISVSSWKAEQASLYRYSNYWSEINYSRNEVTLTSSTPFIISLLSDVV